MRSTKEKLSVNNERNVGVNSGERYVAALWVDYDRHGNGFKVLSEAKLYDHKPTKAESLAEFGEDDEDYEKDKLLHFADVECWSTPDNYAEFGDPAFYFLTISTDHRMDDILDTITKSMRDKIK